MAESFSDRVMKAWWGKILAGLFIAGFSIHQFIQLDRLERGELDSLYVSRLTSFAYDLGGKWVVAAPMVVFGVAICLWGVVQVIRGRE